MLTAAELAELERSHYARLDAKPAPPPRFRWPPRLHRLGSATCTLCRFNVYEYCRYNRWSHAHMLIVAHALDQQSNGARRAVEELAELFRCLRPAAALDGELAQFLLQRLYGVSILFGRRVRAHARG